jgi:hypothetical protein
MGNKTSSISGARRANKRENLPTRLVHAVVVDIRTAIGPAGIPRMQVDAIGITTREPINGAVVLGWSGMQWQSSRPTLKPTTRNILTGKQFSDNAVDRMAEMAYDMVSSGWDGDEVCVAFYGRSAVVLGTFQHTLAWADMEKGEVEEFLEPGRRLQDDSRWDVSSVSEGGDRLWVAQNDSHPDSIPFRWGRIFGTHWETRGFVYEMKRPNNEPGKEGTLYTSRSALLEWSTQWFATESRNIRLVAIDVDDPNSSDGASNRHILEIGDGSPSSYFDPGDAWRVDGIAGFVTDSNDDIVRAFAATDASGGSSKSDYLASATRYPELREYIDDMQTQIDDLRATVEAIGGWLQDIIEAINLIVVPDGVGGVTALLEAGLTPVPGVGVVAITQDTTPVDVTPNKSTLSDSRSKLFRVGR